MQMNSTEDKWTNNRQKKNNKKTATAHVYLTASTLQSS